MRKHRFARGEFYHVYNRGVEKRLIFLDKADYDRFFKSMIQFNNVEPIGSLYWLSFATNKLSGRTTKRLVDIVCYCLNPNHFHLILREVAEGGISEFIKRLAGGYTRYFNIRYKRSGVLFQGKFKSTHVDSNEYLLHLSAYVNLNKYVHKLRSEASRSSADEYFGKSEKAICKKEIIIRQFKSRKEYENFARETLINIRERKTLSKELENLLLE